MFEEVEKLNEEIEELKKNHKEQYSVVKYPSIIPTVSNESEGIANRVWVMKCTGDDIQEDIK